MYCDYSEGRSLKFPPRTLNVPQSSLALEKKHRFPSLDETLHRGLCPGNWGSLDLSPHSSILSTRLPCSVNKLNNYSQMSWCQLTLFIVTFPKHLLFRLFSSLSGRMPVLGFFLYQCLSFFRQAEHRALPLD